ncbi:Cyclin-U4-1 -like protein [Gossypium arboreum]|uniref:Cyclin-U4-1-like protein n=1 Tax=Gossypium arboreum TaxID=29729 RepID=A0A0B0PF81_GOSAR|nr:Cyclin-U4-1 -like protein [Gossypium arboreum]
MQIVALPVLSLHTFTLIGLLKKNPLCPSIHSMFIACLLQVSWLLPSSWMICKYYNNAYYAKVGGISTIEMNYLEMDFLFGLGFHLNVAPNTFYTYFTYLQREIMLQPPPSIAESSLSLDRSLKVHLCFNEEESSHQNQQQLAV